MIYLFYIYEVSNPFNCICTVEAALNAYTIIKALNDYWKDYNKFVVYKNDIEVSPLDLLQMIRDR